VKRRDFVAARGARASIGGKMLEVLKDLTHNRRAGAATFVSTRQGDVYDVDRGSGP
jgi:hypothetical protein